MNYQQAIDYIYKNIPMFQQVGKVAYKEGLHTTCDMDNYFDNPHTHYKTIHVGGTNGKGSCSHTLAAIFQAAGYKTGLFTSPHMLDFRERIRLNGKPVPKKWIAEFITNNLSFLEEKTPSFFELTTIMALKHFSEEKVDIAIIEVGMGGRLDCTNIITPELSIITNISLDHTQFLGDTIEKIAIEKAGIIKPNVPVIIGEATIKAKAIFQEKAKEVNTPVTFAEEKILISETQPATQGGWNYQTQDYKNLYGELGGYYQIKNTNTILWALRLLISKGYNLPESAVKKGFREVIELTGILGRWQKLSENPTIICDTGHNIAGIQFIVDQLKNQQYDKLHIIIGMVQDKDVKNILRLLPEKATYYFTKAKIIRALPEKELQVLGNETGLKGESYPSVKEAYEAALKVAKPQDLIFIGGSTFIVADLLEYLQ